MLHPIITIYFFHIVLSTFAMVLTRRICLTIRIFVNYWSFPLFSWPLHLIQGWFCEEKLETTLRIRKSLLGVKGLNTSLLFYLSSPLWSSSHDNYSGRGEGRWDICDLETGRRRTSKCILKNRRVCTNLTLCFPYFFKI